MPNTTTTFQTSLVTDRLTATNTTTTFNTTRSTATSRSTQETRSTATTKILQQPLTLQLHTYNNYF